MKVKSVRFGTVEVADERIVRLVRPLVGFEQFERYALIDDAESAPVLWMQSLDAPGLLFPVVDASVVTDSYGVDLAEADVAALGLKQEGDARLLFVLTLSPDPGAITANLRAPIVWNTRAATAIQVVVQDAELPVRCPIGAVAGERRSNKEVARACPDAPQG